MDVTAPTSVFCCSGLSDLLEHRATTPLPLPIRISPVGDVAMHVTPRGKGFFVGPVPLRTLCGMEMMTTSPVVVPQNASSSSALMVMQDTNRLEGNWGRESAGEMEVG